MKIYHFSLAGMMSLILAGALLAGCAPTQVQQTSEAPPGLPRPDRILVYDFAVSPQEVQLDQSLSAEIKQRYGHEKAAPRTPQELKIGHAVADVVAAELVKKIQSDGLWAERAMGTPSRKGNTLLIKGLFLSIDEGNRAERVLIGFAAGRTDVQADVQVYELMVGGEREVESLKGSGASAEKPGMAEMMGVGALTHHLLASTLVSGTVAGVSEAKYDTVEDDGRRLAEKIAAELGQFFVEQGWIPSGAVKSSSPY
jgi:outer membrane murein-binding lipoprotein Lpp